MKAIWSLNRGIINPPEPVERPLSLSELYERDSPLTIEQWWREEGIRCGYVKKPPVREVSIVKRDGRVA